MPARRKRRARRRTVGLALGAGGARGIAHIGVLRAFAKAEIPIDAIVGTSVGALIGAVYAAGQLENFERWVRKFDWPDVLRLFDPVWPRSGLISGTRALDQLAEVMGDWKIEDLAIPFAAVSIDLITGEEILMREGRVLDAIRASISIPGIFVPHRMGRRLLVDGALRNPVPVSHLEEMGSDVRVAVNLHAQPVREIMRSKKARDGSTPGTISAQLINLVDRRLARFRRRGHRSRATDDGQVEPNLFEILTASMTVLEHELARHRLAREPVDVVIGPDVHSIRSFEFHKARKAIHAGLIATEKHLPEIRKALERRGPRRRYRRGRQG